MTDIALLLQRYREQASLAQLPPPPLRPPEGRRSRGPRQLALALVPVLAIAIAGGAALAVRHADGHGAAASLGPAPTPSATGTATSTPTPSATGSAGIPPPASMPVLGALVDLRLTESLDVTQVGKPGKLTGEKVCWLTPYPGPSGGLALALGVYDRAWGETSGYEGYALPGDLATTGVHDFQEIDNGDGVAIVSGAGSLTWSLGAPVTVYDLGYEGLRLAVVPGNDARTSYLTYHPAPGESVVSTQLVAEIHVA